MNDRLTFKNIMVFYESLDDQSKIVSIITTLLTFLLTIAAIWYFKIRKPSNKKYVLLVGISNSGKTSIYSQGSYKAKKFDIADLPGNDKVRLRFLNLYKRSARAIVFVVDSSSFVNESKDVAQFLFEILTDDVLTKMKPRIIVACNKQDNDVVKGEQYIRVNLEKEIELLRKISLSALKSTGDSKSKTNKNKLSANDEFAFEFKDLKNFKVDFCEVNTLTSDGIAPLVDLLQTKNF